jgi:RND superfamily putative drug exporter
VVTDEAQTVPPGTDPPTRPSRLSRVTRRRWAWVGVAVWILVLAGAAPASAKLSGVEDNTPVNYLPNNAQSTKVFQALQDFPSAARATAVVVWVNPTSTLTAADRTAIAAACATIARRVPLAGPLGPITISRDGRAAALQVPLPSPLTTKHVTSTQSATVLEHAYDRLRDATPAPAHLEAGVAGPAAFDVQSTDAFHGIDGILILAAGLVVAVLLLLIYRSPVLWLVPLLTSGVALELAQGVVYLLAQGGLTVTGLSTGILDVLVFGAGTDYALLLIARYREELHHHEDSRLALAVALRQAAPAMLASASTVIVSLLCLLAATLNSDRGLGPVAAVGVACAILAALTLLPALLAVSGRRIFWPFIPRVEVGAQPEGLWSRLASRVERRYRPAWVGLVVALGLGACALSVIQLGLPSADAFTNDPPPVQAQGLLDAHFPAGTANPADIVADTASVPTVKRLAASTPGVSAVAVIEHHGTRTHLEALLAAKPDSPGADHAIVSLRARLGAVPAHAIVGGLTAIDFDTNNAARHDRDLVMPLILLVVAIILGGLLRAVLAPVLLVATVILSFAAALGVSAVVFRWLFHFSGTDQSVPLYAFLFLVALGVDYNIFLMTRVREEAVRGGTRRGVHVAVARTGGVITSAGLILAATFAVLGVLPLVVLAEVGFTVAFGILLDTFLVRSVLVPALCFDIGAKVWWPSSLARSSADVRPR